MKQRRKKIWTPNDYNTFRSRPFVETIRIDKGIPQNLYFHQARLTNTFHHFFPGKTPFSIEKVISVPPEFTAGTVKLRFLYDQSGHEQQYSPYVRREVNSLQIVVANDISYAFKTTNRVALSALLEKRGIYDDILIVKNGFITDTFAANIVFSDGKNLFTPANPLLRGTHRERLLKSGIITAIDITIEDLQRFTHFGLINAMTKELRVEQPVENIHSRF